MVSNINMKCEVCNSVIQLKWQIGHFERTPVSIVCPECKTILKFVLVTNQRKVSIDLESKNVTWVNKKEIPSFYAETSSELLTLKISNQMILPGFTPFIRTIQMIGNERYEKYRAQFSSGMYAYQNHLHIYHRLNDLYFNKNMKYLTDQLLKNLYIKNEGQELTKLEIVEKLYEFNINFYNKFTKKGRFGAINSNILSLFEKIRDNHNVEYERFLVEYFTDDLLIDYDKRIYKSINQILDNYPYFMPATILSYINKSKYNGIYSNLTLTTTNFEDVKNIYMTIYENLLSVYEILVYLNNIIERDNYEDFTKSIIINGKTINTVKQFNKLSKGHRIQFLDRRVYFDNIMPEFDRKIRNAIGHESWEYLPYEHKVIFDHEEMYILEFVYKCWNLLEKLMAVYKVIQDIKRHRELTINSIS